MQAKLNIIIQKIASRTLWKQVFSLYLHHTIHNFISVIFNAITYFFKALRQARRSINQNSVTSQIFDARKVSNSSNSISLSIDFISFDVDDIINQSIKLFVCRKSIHRANFISTYQYIVIMISTYEERLIIFKKWFHITFIFENFVVVEFCFESNIKDFIIHSECSLILNNWKFKSNSMKAHMRQLSNCVFVQELNITFKETLIIISVIALINSTSMKFASINDIAFSSQVFYLIIKNLYHKQKTLLVKNEKFETSSSSFIQSKFQFVASFKSQTELKFVKFSRFFKSCKFENLNLQYCKFQLEFDIVDIMFRVNHQIKFCSRTWCKKNNH